MAVISVKILLLLTKQYQDLLNPFMYQFNKYYGANVLVVMDNKPDIRLESNFEYMQVPAYKEGIWDWHKWFSNGLNSIFESIDSELFLIFFPDQWLYAPVDKKLLKQLEQYTLKHKDIIRANVTAGTCLESYGKFIDRYKNLDIIQCDSNNPHCSLCITFCPSIFRKLELESGWSLWDCEKRGSENLTGRVIGTKQSILYRQHVTSHKHPTKLFFDTKLYDINIIKPMVKNWNLNFT